MITEEYNQLLDELEEEIRQEMTWSNLEILRGSRNTHLSMKEDDFNYLLQLIKHKKLHEAIQFSRNFTDPLADYYRAACYYGVGHYQTAYAILSKNKCNHPKRIALTQKIHRITL